MAVGGRIATVLIALLAWAPATASATTITVNGTGDAAANDAACTLREAITAANTNTASSDAANGCPAGQATPTVDAVQFSIAGAGPHVIGVSSDLPAITEPVLIDATSEPDEVRVDNAAAVVTGFDIEADDVEIRDLTITRFFASIDLVGTDGALVEDSFIGTDQAGTAGLGGTGAVRVGTTGTGGEATNATIAGNVIAAQTSYAVQVANDASTGIVIQGNRLGTNPAGTAAMANGHGINVTSGADDVTIGGPNASEANLISGNTLSGIQISNGSETDAATGISIQNNRIGTGIGGEAALPNALGVVVHGNVTGAEIRDNLISGNTGEGVTLSGTGSAAPDPTQTTIASNRIGTDDDGLEDLGNGDQGILVNGVFPDDALTDTVIGGDAGLTAGGPCTGDCNLVAANGNTVTEPNIAVVAPDAAGTEVIGNYVGTAIDGLDDFGDPATGINASAGGSGVVIGSPGAGNVIGGHGSHGILLEGTEGARLQGNFVGVGPDGTTPIANGGHGILARGATTGTEIGGTDSGEGNAVANNAVGVRVEDTASDNAILGNSIHDNGDLGIDLFGQLGVDLNDPLDPDGGANQGQNYPELIAAASGSSTVVAGVMEGKASTDYLIEAFANESGDPSGHGEGQVPLGTLTVTTDGGGDATYTAELAGVAGAGDEVTATATELDGAGKPLSTSEFGPNTFEGCDVTGTAADDPNLVGSSLDEVICGLGGDDVIDGGGGNDIIVGGEGTDEADFSSAAEPIEVDLGTGLGTLGSQSIHIAEIEDITGTDFDDEITGDAAENELTGGDGDDTIEGGGGKDTLKGQNGKDTLKSQDGKDEVKGGDKGDTLKGGDGDKDDLDGNDGGDELNGGGGDKDDCNGGSGNDDHDGGCEKKSSL